MLFAPKKVDPVKQVREWKRNINKEKRTLDREILAIDRTEKKIVLDIKRAAARGDKESAKILAAEVVRARKAKDRLYTSKAQLNSIAMQLQSSLATIRIAGCLQQSTQVMESMNQVLRLPQLHQSMMAMAREMEKTGFIQEMMDDMFEDMEDEEIQDAADEEVEKVFLEITQGILDNGGRVGARLPEREEEQKQEILELSRISVPTN